MLRKLAPGKVAAPVGIYVRGVGRDHIESIRAHVVRATPGLCWAEAG